MRCIQYTVLAIVTFFSAALYGETRVVYAVGEASAASAWVVNCAKDFSVGTLTVQ